MLKHFFITAWRNVRRNKVFSLINLAGLAIGMGSFILIMMHVTYERGYDTFNENFPNIYRVNIDFYENGELKHQFASSNAGMAPVFTQVFSEVRNACRIFRYEGVVAAGDQHFYQEVCYGSSSIFEVFTLPVIRGRYKTLEEPNVVFLSESLSLKYFGDQDPMGQTVNFNGESDLMVAGIFADIPQHSHFRFDFLISWPTLEKIAGHNFAEGWDFVDTHTYLLLGNNAYIPALEEKLTEYQHMMIKDLRIDEHPRSIVRLQPLSEIHLHSHYLTEFSRNGNAEAVDFLSIIAFFILIMAAVNFMNLSTARASRRSLEMDIRRVHGARRAGLFFQLLGESFLIVFAAHIIAMAAVEFSLPWFNRLTGNELVINYADPELYLFLGLLVISGTLLAGGYPAAYLSKLKAEGQLRPGGGISPGRVAFRQGLVGFQFMTAIALVAGLLVVWRQTDFMKTAEKGFDIENMLIVQSPSVVKFDEPDGGADFGSKLDMFAHGVGEIPGVVAVASSSAVPGKQNASGNVAWAPDESRHVFCYIDGVDRNFFTLYQIRMLAGGHFGDFENTDPGRAVVNLEFARLYGYQDPAGALNKKFLMFGQEFNIAGVCSNIHHFGLRNPVGPMVYLAMPPDPDFHRFYTIKLERPLDQEIISRIETQFTGLFPGNAFSWYDLKANYNLQYTDEVRFSTVVLLFTILSLVIVCLGLLGLSIYIAETRVKEIGIRKVFGASGVSVFILLTQGILKILLISACISLPLIWLAARTWLDHFAYAAGIGAWFFVIPVLVVGLVSFSVILTHVIKSSRQNPSWALRYE